MCRPARPARPAQPGVRPEQPAMRPEQPACSRHEACAAGAAGAAVQKSAVHPNLGCVAQGRNASMPIIPLLTRAHYVATSPWTATEPQANMMKIHTVVVTLQAVLEQQSQPHGTVTASAAPYANAKRRRVPVCSRSQVSCSNDGFRLRQDARKVGVEADFLQHGAIVPATAGPGSRVRQTLLDIQQRVNFRWRISISRVSSKGDEYRDHMRSCTLAAWHTQWPTSLHVLVRRNNCQRRRWCCC
jgi:hypothetical protein